MEITIGLPVFLFLIWFILIYFWFYSESEDMTTLLSVIFVPYDVFFTWYALPLFNAEHFVIKLLFISIALIVSIYTIDLHRKKEKK